MKSKRQQVILQLIEEHPIDRQEELLQRLKAAGFEVTQATVSRDIRQLNLTKMPTENGHFRYVLMQKKDQNLSEKYARVLKDAVLSMDVAQNILVIKTVSGMAMAAAAALDELNWGEIVGCIAGDNTIMCAVRSAEEAVQAVEKLKKMLDIFGKVH